MAGRILIRSLRTCCRYIPSHLLPLHFKGKKEKPQDWASPFARQEHGAHQTFCPPPKKLWWIGGCSLWPLNIVVSLYSKVWAVLAQTISCKKQGNPMKELASLCLLIFWFWQHDERGREKLWTFITLLVSSQGWVNRQAATCKRRVLLGGEGW